MRIKRGRVWIEAGIAADPFRQRPPDGLDGWRRKQRLKYNKLEAYRLAARDRKRRQRERDKGAVLQGTDEGVTHAVIA